jgi:hypothetical protein
MARRRRRGPVRRAARDVMPDRWSIRFLTAGRHHTWAAAKRAVTGTRTVTSAKQRRPQYQAEQRRERRLAAQERARERRERRAQASGRRTTARGRAAAQQPDTLGAYLKAQWDWPRVGKYRNRWTKPFPEARRNAIPHFGKRMSDPAGIRNCPRCKGRGRLSTDDKPQRLGPRLCPLCQERIEIRQKSAELAKMQRGLPKRRLRYAPQRYDPTNRSTARKSRKR